MGVVEAYPEDTLKLGISIRGIVMKDTYNKYLYLILCQDFKRTYNNQTDQFLIRN